jgi:hypothetical protein
MATNFPGGIDTFVNPNATSSLDSPSHAGLHTDLADGMTAVQTQLVNQPYGLVHLNTTSFSAVASQSIENVFSANYDNYRVIFVGTCSATNVNFSMRLRVSGADNSTSSYNGRTLDITTALNLNADTSATSFLTMSNLSTIDSSAMQLEIYRPFATALTSYSASTSAEIGGARMTRISGGYFNATTSFTGFTVFPGSGNITGSISTYGYRKS